MSSTTTWGRGLLAGAAGNLVLDAVTYLDMAVRARPASEVPARTAEAGLDRAGLSVSDDQAEAAGALAGIATGVGVGVATAVVRSAGVRLSPLGGAVVTGAVAMAVSDGGAALAGVTDPRGWGATDWVSDVVPHLAFGLTVHEVVRRLEPATDQATPAGAGLVARSFALGLAAGSRSTLGLAGAAWVGSGAVGRSVAGALVAAELAADKLPQAPSRLEPQGAVPRGLTAGVGGLALARRARVHADLPVLAAGAGSVLGTVLGSLWRERSPWSATTSALVEDAAALGLVGLAVRGLGRRTPPPPALRPVR